MVAETADATGASARSTRKRRAGHGGESVQLNVSVPVSPALLEPKNELQGDKDVKEGDTKIEEDHEAGPPEENKADGKLQTKEADVKASDEEEEEDEEEDEGDEDELLVQPKEPRREVPPDATFRSDAVHVYGLDLLKQEHMGEIFSQFGYKFIEWINDSSANVVFKDAARAQQTLESLSYDKANDSPWRRTPDIVVAQDQPPIFLQMRLAMPADKKPPKGGQAKAIDGLTPMWRSSRSKGKGRGRGRRADQQKGPSEKKSGDEDHGLEERPGKARKVISEEELEKRRKRAERFSKQPAVEASEDT